ncbi:MAG TPA: beta-propeller domain-containing protein [Longimicrobium sp.]|nr:beta-propeller domain-containing protein [Longimicrobium sp.]
MQREIDWYERQLRRAPPAPPPPPPAPGSESITSVQTEGVDEGDIVKVHGDHLVVLRRGRLFTVRIGGDALQPVAIADAFGPGIDPAYSWYDEMLVSGDDVVVIGYSYQRGGTELGIFRVGADGSLAHRGTYHLRSGDYYSSRNYASRLIGDRLIFYSPIPVRRGLMASLPAMRRWGGADSAWTRTVTAQRIYRPAGGLRADEGIILHTVTACDLRQPELRCESTALMGPYGSEFYVSAGSVYVWTDTFGGEGNDPEHPRSFLFRMPLDGTAPTGLRVGGVPIDQFSFLESRDEHLNVLVRTGTYAQGALALLRVPLSSLGDGSRAAPAEAYRPLPGLAQNGSAQNRFVGDWLLYGGGAGWGPPRPGGTTAYAVRWAGGDVSALALPHAVDRIEAMGPAAVLVGGDGQALHFTPVRLDGPLPRTEAAYVRPGAAQGETRSHGFFYRAESAQAGVLGLPLRSVEEPGQASLWRGSASLLFLRNEGLRLRELGALPADTTAGPDDACRASCVDWYGNARPIFLRGRVFALMGYELVEGALDGGRIRERRRVSFAPRFTPMELGGDWTFTEAFGVRSSVYFCDTRGTMTFDQQGHAVSMRYRQTGECVIEGAASRSDGQGSGRGDVNGKVLMMDVDACRYRGEQRAPGLIEGNVQCRVRPPVRGEMTVYGTWRAYRGGS